MSNNRKEKFKFVSLEEVDTENQEPIVNVDIENDSEEKIDKKVEVEQNEIENEESIDNKDELDNIIDSYSEEKDTDSNDKEEVKEETKDENKQDTKTDFELTEKDHLKKYEREDFPTKKHISFGKRVTIMILLIIILFAVSCILMLQALNVGKVESIKYSEKSTSKYQVCLNDPANTDVCFGEGIDFTAAAIGLINVNYNYKIDFSKKIEYDVDYYVNAETEVLDSYGGKVYTDDTTINGRTPIQVNNNHIKFNTNASINYVDFYNLILPYLQLDNTYTANVKLQLVLVEPDEERVVSTITVPLNEPVFRITSDNIDESKTIKTGEEEWTDYNSICMFISSILIIIALVLVYKVTHLIIKVINNKNKYQKVLEEILREYDRMIVIARDGYESNIEKEIIKVKDFDELLDARALLDKPIVFSRINDVKSEFIVEDDNRLYKYIFKEADITEE